jgi:pyruvate dehydrogenase E2 component (dihydrolipoamide acetyltransferase)
MKTQNGQLISPRALRVLKQMGLESETIVGSGPNGRILEADLLKIGGPSGAKSSVASMRKAIAKLTSESFATVPHFYLRAELDAEPLVNFRSRMIDVVKQEVGVKITLTDFILRAMGLALEAYPSANCIWQNDTVVSLPQKDVGLVVGLPEGLLIPVITGVDRLTLSGLAQRRSQLVDFARAGRLPNEAMKSRVACSLSNLGISRVDEFSAIIPPPQSSILAVGRIAERPYVIDGKLVVRSTMKLCLSVDHRVMDGTQGAEFLGKIVDLLERPEQLIAQGVS